MDSSQGRILTVVKATVRFLGVRFFGDPLARDSNAQYQVILPSTRPALSYKNLYPTDVVKSIFLRSNIQLNISNPLDCC